MKRLLTILKTRVTSTYHLECVTNKDSRGRLAAVSSSMSGSIDFASVNTSSQNNMTKQLAREPV